MLNTVPLSACPPCFLWPCSLSWLCFILTEDYFLLINFQGWQSILDSKSLETGLFLSHSWPAIPWGWQFLPLELRRNSSTLHKYRCKGESLMSLLLVSRIDKMSFHSGSFQKLLSVSSASLSFSTLSPRELACMHPSCSQGALSITSLHFRGILTHEALKHCVPVIQALLPEAVFRCASQMCLRVLKMLYLFSVLLSGEFFKHYI